MPTRYGYPQAEPPSPVTCAVYLLVALFFLGTTAVILARSFGVW